MILSNKELDRWATWLDLETSYAITKFKTPEQLAYFRMGVSRGEFSWASSAAGYLHRAGMLADISDFEARLRLVLNVGKSAHNHIACAATARVHYGRASSLIAAYFDVQNEWRSLVANIDPLRIDCFSGVRQGKCFEQLQGIQDANDPDEFETYLTGIALPVHAGFIALCSEYEWPQPGVSSTNDVRRWEASGDPSVEALLQN